ncbi:aromatic ring-hydroxylating oxygenase subunit alpha [Fodinibius halophilus]|uniref:Aromatic ring-hydroxylating dioxygenase subunit alpha n=1 Tax=Fodinibius halophilus TaxID=1736908 RepID=A0A6M1T237_9BACT|nr:aromatic ring-hydroxylating dioxygenase subunit alpha [Fodinibius halophilus]NGP88067.1 aromatic ring-hydroxylating dioxygenase subunit alpha [Fodinibius halophilus]
MDTQNLPNITSENLQQKPIECAETIPSSWYHSDEILEFEKETIFSNCWQLACHTSELPQAGDMHTLEVADNPLLLVRNQEQQINAFYNVCKHRGGPVAVKKGTTSVLQCQYHGWTYLLDGSLRGVPHFRKVELFDKKDFGLQPVKLDQWQGLQFISLDDEIKPIGHFLDGIADTIAPVDLSEFQFVESQSYTINCNWKVYVDNFLEGYHIPIVHPELAKLLDYGEYKTDTADWYSLQHSPFKNKGDDNVYQTSDGQAYYYFIFPNIMLNILPGRLQTNVIRPITPTQTEVIFNFYYLDPDNKQLIKDDMEYSHNIQVEDIEICELVQKGLKSNAYDKGRFSVQREKGVYHFQSLLKQEFAKSIHSCSG